MSINIKKILLLILIVPSATLWASLCLLGLLFLADASFKELKTFVLIIFLMAAIFCSVTAVVAVIRYPIVKIGFVYAALLGIAEMIFGICVGIPYSPMLAISAVSLIFGGIFLSAEYFKVNKISFRKLFSRH